MDIIVDELLNEAKNTGTIIMDENQTDERQEAYNIMIDLHLIEEYNQSAVLADRGNSAIKLGGLNNWKKKRMQYQNMKNNAKIFTVVASIFGIIGVILRIIL